MIVGGTVDDDEKFDAMVTAAKDAERQQKQAAVTELADILVLFRNRLIGGGFSTEAAEAMTSGYLDALLAAVLAEVQVVVDEDG